LVREALETLATRKRHSVTARVDEILPELEGPRDLSVNPKHMDGYGK
jgi:hypothetical protein